MVMSTSCANSAETSCKVQHSDYFEKMSCLSGGVKFGSFCKVSNLSLAQLQFIKMSRMCMNLAIESRKDPNPAEL